MPFSPQTAESLLVKSARCCCLCRQFKGTKIEVHHIVPEAKGGTDDQANGIPLCFDCHSDVQTYNDKHPRGKKYRTSELKRHRDGVFKLIKSGKLNTVGVNLQDSDRILIQFYCQCFDRPAFQDRFVQERSVEAFDKAFEDTITATNTGCLMDRDGRVLSSAQGKSFLQSADHRKSMDEVVRILRLMRKKYDTEVKAGKIWQGSEDNGVRMYCINDSGLTNWFDDTRVQLIHIINTLCRDIGNPTLGFPLSLD